MRLASLCVLCVIALLIGPALAQTVPAAKINRRAALIEVLPPESMQKSPAAVELANREVRKHALMLQHPALIAQVMQTKEIHAMPWIKNAGDSAADKLLEAIHVRVVPDTNIIELTIDPAAGDDAPALAEAIVNQHMQNQTQIQQNKQLERSVILNNLKQRYQFRKDELGRDLREKAVQLSVDGMGMPGRLSAREFELTQLLTLRFELERKKTEAAPSDRGAIEAQIKMTSERIDAAKRDLGELTNAMNQYLVLKDDEQKTRELLAQVNKQLEEISQMGNMDWSNLRWLYRPGR